MHISNFIMTVGATLKWWWQLFGN